MPSRRGKARAPGPCPASGRRPARPRRRSSRGSRSAASRSAAATANGKRPPFGSATWGTWTSRRWRIFWPCSTTARRKPLEDIAMSRIVVAEKLSPAGLDRLRQAGHDVVDLSGAPREQLLSALEDADALLVRSATKVDSTLLAAAPRLTVVGRAGVGVDNVDVPAASARGVLVLNSPTGNVVSAVQHTFAVLLALLRRIPEASASMAAGRWEKSKFVGSELAGK